MTTPIDLTVNSIAESSPTRSNGTFGLVSYGGFWFWFSVMAVAMASIYDAYLVYEYRDVVIEQNPICKWLIELEPESVMMFLLGKGLGTLGVVSILVGLRKFWRPVSLPVALSLVAFQCGLMGYLHGSDDLPRMQARRIADHAADWEEYQNQNAETLPQLKQLDERSRLAKKRGSASKGYPRLAKDGARNRRRGDRRKMNAGGRADSGFSKNPSGVRSENKTPRGGQKRRSSSFRPYDPSMI
ncbi:MAG: hypothetical protein ACI87E_002663 [Mariniblastus sp.]|jgi:hypothetical protein